MRNAIKFYILFFTENVVHRDELIGFRLNSRAHSAQLLHVRADAEIQAHVNAERANVRSRLAGEPKDSEIALGVELEQFRTVHGSYAKNAFDSGNERRSLEERARHCLDHLRHLFQHKTSLIAFNAKKRVIRSKKNRQKTTPTLRCDSTGA